MISIEISRQRQINNSKHPLDGRLRRIANRLDFEHAVDGCPGR